MRVLFVHPSPLRLEPLRQLHDHEQPVQYALRQRKPLAGKPSRTQLYVHDPVASRQASR